MSSPYHIRVMCLHLLLQHVDQVFDDRPLLQTFGAIRGLLDLWSLSGNVKGGIETVSSCIVIGIISSWTKDAAEFSTSELQSSLKVLAIAFIHLPKGKSPSAIKN